MKRNWILLFLWLLAVVLIGYRAYVIPMTHDEASTWLNYRHINVWSCISNPACWGTANNHWLNTLLLQWSATLWGDGPFALRLPNVIAGVGYCVCAFLISIHYSKNQFLQCAGFLLLCAHVYLLDFFSLARGYGIMVSGVIWAIYFLLRYNEKFELRWLVFCLTALIFSILGNFTGLLPFATIGLGWFLWLVLHKKYRLLIFHGIAWLCTALLLFLLLRFPIKVLSGSGEFEWGSQGLWSMSLDLMNNLLYGARYWGDRSSLILLVTIVVGMIIAIVAGLLVKEKKDSGSLYFVALLLFLNFFILFLHHRLTGAFAPVGRKTIYLIPFIFGLLTLGIGLIHKQSKASISGIIISLLLLLNLVSRLPLRSCREWYYDAYYPELLSTLFPGGATSDSVRLGMTWIFNPALQYYQKTIPLPFSGMVYQKPLVIDSTMQYYYVETSDTTGMSSNGFVLDKKIGPFILFKNKHSR